MKESYFFKDILFGLYKEYIMLREQLDSLNKYVLLEENNLSEVKFCITDQITDNRVRMLCYLYNEKTKLEKMMKIIGLSVENNSSFKASYIDEVDGCYEILQYPEVIDKTKQQEFSQSVFYILNTDFGKNIKLIHNGTGYDGKPFLSVASYGIFTCLDDTGQLDFNPGKDNYLHAYSSKGRLSKDKVDYMLNMEFSKNRFPEYYRNLIESADTFGKKLDVVGDFGYSKKGKFEIVPESKKLVLVKR